MGRKILKSALTKPKLWICRKLCKSCVSVLVLSVILQCAQLTTSFTNKSQNQNQSSIISSLPLINDRTPRSINPSEKLRIFKYVTETETEAQLHKPLSQDETTTESKTFDLNSTIKPVHHTPTSRKRKKSKNQGRTGFANSGKLGKNVTMQNQGVGFDPVLPPSRASSVTDRSLIPNSFFMPSSDLGAQNQNVNANANLGVGVNLHKNEHQVGNQAVKNHLNNHNLVQKSDSVSSGSHQNQHQNSRQHQHQQNGNYNNKQDASSQVTDGFVSSSKSSSLNGTDLKRVTNNTSLAQNRNASSQNQQQNAENINIHDTRHNSSSSDEVLSFNATLSLTERSRRSPFGRRNVRNNFNNGNGNRGQRIMYQNHMPIMHQSQNMERRVFKKNAKNGGGGGPFVRKVQNGKRLRNKGNGNNRAALFNRNPHHNGIPGVLVAMPNPAFHPQNMANVQIVGNVNGNYNTNRGVAMVVPPKMQQGQPHPQSLKLDPILPSPSSDFLQYQNHPILEEPTWNHPMYQRYAKAAKNVQNKVSNYMRPNNPGRRDINFRSDFSKIPPIPLPRPRPGGGGKVKFGPPRGVRSRPGPPLPPPGRYTYPKSAQSIQDILNHFEGGENDIMNDVEGPGPKGSGSRYPTKKRHHQQPRDRDRPNRHRDDNPYPGPQPGSIADLSSELTDVKFSLLRDIREFAKRPMNMGESDGGDTRNDYSPPDRYKKDPLILRSPPSQKPPRRRDEHDEEDDAPWRKVKNINKYGPDADDPFSPGFNHEDGFDEIFHPKPKPVRELIHKQSSRFRNPERGDDHDNHDPPDHHHSRKKGFSDRDKYAASEHEDSTERSPPRRGSGGERSPFSGSVEIETEPTSERRRDDGGRDGDRDRDRNRIRNRDRDRDRDKDRSYLSSFESERIRRPQETRRDRDREKETDYPKSIRDKIRDIHSPPEYDYDSGDGRNQYRYLPPPSPPITENKPIVLKRPFEPYPPTYPGHHGHGEVVSKKLQNHEFWTNHASATERSSHGHTIPSNLNYNVATSLSPPPLLSPHQQFHPSDPVTATLNPYGRDTDDILEIHTGQRYPPLRSPSSGLQSPHNLNPYSPPAPPADSTNSANDLHKAYLELLHQKIHSEQALLNNQQQQHSIPLPPPTISTTTRKIPTPMRMKIHIYPNGDHTEATPQLQQPQSQPQPQPSLGVNVNHGANVNQHQHMSNPMTQYHLGSHPSGFYSGGGSSYSSNTVPLLSPRYPQKVAGSLNGYHLGPGPAPPLQIGRNGNGNPQVNFNPHLNGDLKVQGQGQGSSSSSNKNSDKNLVLHLHVHRRNDAGPVELEAEASDHFMSTDKPINYKEIYDDDHNNGPNDYNNASNHASSSSANNNANHNNGENEGDKSVSMEVPIHDDKIEDVLHTLLQLRDRKNPSRKRKRRKSKD